MKNLELSDFLLVFFAGIFVVGLIGLGLQKIDEEKRQQEEFADGPDAISAALPLEGGSAQEAQGTTANSAQGSVDDIRVTTTYAQNIADNTAAVAHRLRIMFVNTDGKEIAQEHSLMLQEGAQFQVYCPDILDYFPETHIVRGEMEDEDLEITVIYYSTQEALTGSL